MVLPIGAKPVRNWYNMSIDRYSEGQTMTETTTKIEFRTDGNLFGAEGEVDALVNTVNCEGYMGRGVALEAKKRFKENYEAYARACEVSEGEKWGEVRPGEMFVAEIKRPKLTKEPLIINFPTKGRWRGKSKMEYIKKGLIDLGRVIHEREIKKIAIPPLGCGLGGLDWSEVKREIVAVLMVLPGLEYAIVYEPNPELDTKPKPRKTRKSRKVAPNPAA